MIKSRSSLVAVVSVIAAGIIGCRKENRKLIPSKKMIRQLTVKRAVIGRRWMRAALIVNKVINARVDYRFDGTVEIHAYCHIAVDLVEHKINSARIVCASIT